MKFPARLRLPSATLAAALLVLAGCASAPPAPPATAGPARPKLVVMIVIDGFPQRQLTDYRDQLGPDGFARFLDRGAWFADAHYGYGFTVTAAGHAVLLTGAYPHRTGIIGNEWRDRATGELRYCTQDAAYTYIGHRTAKLDGTSPRNLRVETVGDVLRRADARSKVIAISGKDRGAILPAGHAGTAYMYMKQTGLFASSTYYMKAHPAWVDAFNAAKPADRFFKAAWTPLLPEMAYARSVPDGQPWFAKGGRLPRVLGEGQDSPGPLFYDDLNRSPFLDAMTLDFARAAMAGEDLGTDDAPDILSVSLSGHDIVNHSWGAESRLSHDHVLQLDNLLAAFFRDLDRRYGPEGYVALLTADHGFMPAPEHSKAQGRDAGRQSASQAIARVNAGLAPRFGEGAWVRHFSAQAVQFDPKLLAEKKPDLAALAAETKALLAREPGFAAAYTRAEILGTAPADAPYLALVRKAFHADLSGDVQAVLRPHWMFASSSSAATHGSPHPYDTHVPIAFYGPAWVKAGRRDGRVDVSDIAPTIARLLAIPAPAASEGRPLPLAP